MCGGGWHFRLALPVGDGWMCFRGSDHGRLDEYMGVLRDYEMEIWEMVDKVSLRCIRRMVLGIFPICQNSKIMFLAMYKRVLAYHKRTKVWKEMYTLKNGSALPLWFSAHAFRSSLTSCS
ncbi:F-box protein-like protein [Drosera capensis]